MILRTGLTSSFPRSEALVARTRDLDRGRTSAEAVDELYARTEEEILALETRLGLDTVTAGYSRWPDLFRPIASTWRGFTVGPLTRWFETNTFFRQPILHAPPERVAGAFAAQLPGALTRAADRARILLPGPYTLTGLLDNRSGETDEALVHRFGRLLGEEVKELRGRGFSTFQFQEPLLAVHPPEGPPAESTVAAYAAIRGALDGGTSIVWTYHGDAQPALPLLRRLPVTVVGVDLSETDWEQIPPDSERRAIGLGVIDSRTTLVEDPAEVARIVRGLQERLKPSAVWLGPGAPLDLLPWEPATRKLHVLPATRQALDPGEGARR